MQDDTRENDDRDDRDRHETLKEHWRRNLQQGRRVQDDGRVKRIEPQGEDWIVVEAMQADHREPRSDDPDGPTCPRGGMAEANEAVSDEEAEQRMHRYGQGCPDQSQAFPRSAAGRDVEDVFQQGETKTDPGTREHEVLIGSA